MSSAGPAKRGDRSGAGKKGKYGQGGGRYTSQRPIAGPGLFATCVRGKEARAVDELYDLLEQYADQLYPPERLDAFAASLAAQRPFPDPTLASPSTSSALAPSDAHPASTATIDDDSDEEHEDESIEATIARELAQLKSKRSKLGDGSIVKNNLDVNDQRRLAMGKPIRARFESLKTETECVIFIAFKRPYDPVEIVHAIARDIQRTGTSKTQYIQRLEPVSTTCHALSMDQIEMISDTLIKETFYRWAEQNGTTNIKYQIEPSIRCHQNPLNRKVVIDILGPLVRALASPPTPAPDSPPEEAIARPLLNVSADLQAPNLVLLPIVLRNVFAVGIVEGSLWVGKGKKFNLETMGSAARLAIDALTGPTAVRGAALPVSLGAGAQGKED